VALCPEVFSLDADGFSQVKKVEKYDSYPIQDAIDSCPNQAINWDK